MAGATIYYTYDTTSRAVKTIHQSAADATSAVVTGTAAYTAGVTEARNIAGQTVDAMLAEPDNWHHATSDPRLREGVFDATPARTAIRTMHNRYDDLYELLHQLGPSYPPDDVLAIDRLLHRLHGGVYVVMNDVTLTNQQKLQWLAAQAQGPADSGYDQANPTTIAPIIEAIAEADRETVGAMFIAYPGDGLVKGSSGPAFGTRLTLAQSFDADFQSFANRMPTITQLGGGSWINGVNF